MGKILIYAGLVLVVAIVIAVLLVLGRSIRPLLG